MQDDVTCTRSDIDDADADDGVWRTVNGHRDDTITCTNPSLGLPDGDQITHVSRLMVIVSAAIANVAYSPINKY